MYVRRVDRQVQSQAVFCSNDPANCKWVGAFSDSSHHALNTCEFRPKPAMAGAADESENTDSTIEFRSDDSGNISKSDELSSSSSSSSPGSGVDKEPLSGTASSRSTSSDDADNDIDVVSSMHKRVHSPSSRQPVLSPPDMGLEIASAGVNTGLVNPNVSDHDHALPAGFGGSARSGSVDVLRSGRGRKLSLVVRMKRKLSRFGSRVGKLFSRRRKEKPVPAERPQADAPSVAAGDAAGQAELELDIEQEDVESLDDEQPRRPSRVQNAKRWVVAKGRGGPVPAGANRRIRRRANRHGSRKQRLALSGVNATNSARSICEQWQSLGTAKFDCTVGVAQWTRSLPVHAVEQGHPKAKSIQRSEKTELDRGVCYLHAEGITFDSNHRGDKQVVAWSQVLYVWRDGKRRFCVEFVTSNEILRPCVRDKATHKLGLYS